MIPFRERRYMHGAFRGLRHVSWFLSPANREAFHKDTCDLVPNNFSEVPYLMRHSTRCSLTLAAVSPPDRHGYFSLGTHADYAAAMIGDVPFFVEANHQMPRTYGENQVHISQVVGWCEADYPLTELLARPARETDRRIAELVAERIPDGATLQAGLGSIPNEVMGLLGEHKDLGVNTELLSDGFVDLIEKGVITGTRKRTHRHKVVATKRWEASDCTSSWTRTQASNSGPSTTPMMSAISRAKIASSPSMPPWRSTFSGSAPPSRSAAYTGPPQAAKSTARGALLSEHGQSFIVLHSTTADESVSRIVAQLHPGAAVTTFKNIVDYVVTEYGVAELRGSSIRERTRKLIRIAHPKFHDELECQAREMNYL